jgi:hypothetical protein
MHDLDDPGEEGLRDLVGIVAPPGQQQVFELVERDHHRRLQRPEDLHQHLEEREHKVLSRGSNLERHLDEVVGQEVGERGLFLQKMGTGEPAIDLAAHQPGDVVGLGLLDVRLDEHHCRVDRDPGLGQCLGNRHWPATELPVPTDVINQPLTPLQRLTNSEAEFPRPPAQAGRGEQLQPLIVGQTGECIAQQSADDVLADMFQRPNSALFAAAKQRVNDLEKQVFEEVRVLLVNPRRDQELPGTVSAVLDRVQQVRLAGALVAEYRNDFRVRARVVSVQVNDREQKPALARVQVGDVVPRAHLIVRVAREVVPEGIARPAQRFDGAVHARVAGSGGRHVRTSMFW